MRSVALGVGLWALVASAGPVLTLDETLKLVNERNLDLKAANEKVAQAREQARRVWTAYLPQLSVGGAYTRNSVEAKIGLPTGYYVRDAGRNPVTGEPNYVGPPFDPSNPMMGLPTTYYMVPAGFMEATIQAKDQLGAQAQVNQLLLAPALWPAIANAYKGAQVAQVNVEAARRELVFAAAQLYYGIEGLKEAVNVQEKLLEMNRAHELDAQRRFEAGAAPKLDYLRAQIDRSKSEQDVQRAKNSLLGLKSSLATLLDRDADFDVERPPEPKFDARVGADEGEVLKARPDVRAARLAAELADGLHDGVWYQFAPSVAVNGAWRWSNVTGFTGRKDSWAITLGLNWTLWDGGGRESQLREASHRLVEANHVLRNAENKAKDELRRARLDLESAIANRRKAEQSLVLAREAAELAKSSYAAGAGTYLQVADANTALLASELGAIGESLNAQLALLKLAKAAGVFGAP